VDGCRGRHRRAVGRGRRLIQTHEAQGILPISKISPCLRFDGEAEVAAKFYVSLLCDSRIETIKKHITRR
jgi:hypothetical protein